LAGLSDRLAGGVLSIPERALGVGRPGLCRAPGLVQPVQPVSEFTKGEVRTMIRIRRKRTVVWLLVLGSVGAALGLIRMEDRAGGPFQVRPATRAELRAPVAGFLRAVYLGEGDRVAPGMLVARLDVPDLKSRQARKRAEVAEARARLRLL